MPEKLLTLSTCLTSTIPDGWPSPALPPFPRPRAPADLPDDVALRIEAWAAEATKRDPSLWPWYPATLEEARSFGRQFLRSNPELVLLGVAVSSEDVSTIVELGARSASERASALHAGAPAVRDGVGVLRGFEVLGDGVREAHSPFCTGSEIPLHDELGVAFNPEGLIDDWNAARKAAEWMSMEEHGEYCGYHVFRMTEFEWR